MTTQDDLERISLEVYDLARQEVLVHLRFLNGACALLKPYPRDGASLATDGALIRYDPRSLVKMWKDEPSACARAYLHMVLHNAFLHTYPGDLDNPLAWNTACDIAVEAVIADLAVPALATLRSNAQHAVFAQVAEDARHMTAESLYRHFIEQDCSDQVLERLRAPFVVDDHSLWHEAAARFAQALAPAAGSSEEGAHSPTTPQEAGSYSSITSPDGAKPNAQTRSSHQSPMQDAASDAAHGQDVHLAMQGRMANTVNLERMRNHWESAALEMGVQLDSYVRLYGTQGSALSMSLANVTRRRRDYRAFLRNFAMQGEHIRINDDEFDYVHYCYGLGLYGNLPLIEPLEYAEEKRIRQLVIAIDTSASTKDGLVRRFIEQTSSVLGNESSFFEDAEVLLMQCDAQVTDEVRIASPRDFEHYLNDLTIEGLGGTDFRPVFARIDELRDAGQLREMAGLLYFTDGYGAFPRIPPDYKCAFVFADPEAAESAHVPSWAMKTSLDDELRTRRLDRLQASQNETGR